MEFLDYEMLNVALMEWLIALGVALLIAFGIQVVSRIASNRVEKLAGRTTNRYDDLVAVILKNTKGFTLLAFGLWVAIWFRQFPEVISGSVGRVAFLILLVQTGLWGGHVIHWWMTGYREEKMDEDPSAVTTMQAMSILGRIALWLILSLVALDNFGIDVTALVTGLGIGGIAVALAVQNILGDIFGSLSIIFDKPFVVGDFLIVNDYLGTVEYIGLKTTRIRSLSGEQIIFSNSDLLGSRIRNYKRMYERRIVFSVGVEYGTPRDKLAEIPGVLKEAVEAQEETRFDRAHFKSFGDFALLFEVVYFVLKPDYNIYMDIQQAINMQIVRAFKSMEVSIAFPTQKLFLEMQQAEGAEVGADNP
jgi:small-conductance mechanosensitive channel